MIKATEGYADEETMVDAESRVKPLSPSSIRCRLRGGRSTWRQRHTTSGHQNTNPKNSMSQNTTE